jgi:hypothetical protein
MVESMIRRFTQSAVVISLFSAFFACSASSSKKDLMREFLNSPNQSHFENFISSLQNESQGTSDEVAGKIIGSLAKDSLFSKLLLLIREDNANSVKIGFCISPLLKNAPAMREDLEIDLGKLIERDPGLYLRSIHEYLKSNPKTSFDLFAIASASGINDNFVMMITEADRRIASLETVQDPVLYDVRDRSIVKLKERKQFYLRARDANIIK